MVGRYLNLFMVILITSFFAGQAFAACGGTVRTWDSNSGNTTWSKTGNWTNNNIPNTTGEDAVIQAAQSVTELNGSYSIGCVEVTSGELNSTDGVTLTVNGDYYRAINLNSVVVTAGHNFTIDMAGTGAQSLESVDPLNNVTISNSTNVTFTDPFEIRNTLSITGTGTTLYIQDNLILSDTGTAFTVPSGTIVEVQSGAELKALGGLTVNGTLIVKAGASIVLGDSMSLTVPSGGLLKLEGASGNIATIKGNGSLLWNMSVAGDLWANYFRMDGVGKDTKGIDITGSVQKMDNGEFHFIESSGYAMTWGAAASLPGAMSNMSFFDDNGYANNGSIDASSYNLTDVAFSNWAGLGCTTEGCANENDPNGKVDWGSQAGVALTLSTNGNSGKPSDPTTAGAGADEFAIFAFALNQAATTTNITEITFTLEGTGKAGDIDHIEVYADSGSCQSQGAQIGSNLSFSGSPAKATLTITNPTDLQVSGTTPDCIHVHLQTTASAENAVTVGISIGATADVTNSQGYTFSATSGPKVSGPLSTISGDPTRIWNGNNNTDWARDGNWTNGTFPTSANNCRIGAGLNVPALGGNQACQNLDLINGGEITWGANDLAAFGTLTVASGFTFTSAGTGTLTMGGVNSQSLTLSEAFPGTLVIDNSSPTEVVSVDGDSYVTGNLTLTDGTLSIPDGITLQVGGNVTVASGAVLDIQPGGTLELTTDNATITVADGGSLELVGTSGKTATIKTDSTAKHYSITVGAGTSGDISAQYYTILNGRLTVSANATINATNDLSNGTFSCPDSSVSALTINQQVNGDDLDGMAFSSGACSPASVVSVDTSGMVGTGVALNMTNWSGDLAGTATESENVGGYDVTWGAQSNTIKLTQEATRTNASGDQGTTQNMGRWGFQQNAGAGFSAADITSLKITLTGSGSSNDVSAVRVYEDSDCDSAGGTLIGTGTFAGFPASVTFSGLTTTIPTDVTSPAMMCIYVEYDIANFATNAATVGAEISASLDVVNDQSYLLDASFSAPVNLGTLSIVGITTNWTGANSSNWSDAGNWSSGEPTSSINCVIPSVAGTDPIITGTEECKTLSVTNGNLTINAGGNLQLYGSFISTGTYSNSGTVTMVDNGVDATNQTISNSSGSMAGPAFSKTAGGTVKVSDATMTFTSFSIAGGNTFEYQVPSAQALTLSGGATLTSGTFTIQDGGTVAIGSGQTVTVNGGAFQMDGTAEAPPLGTCGDTTDTVSSCYASSKATLRASSGTYSFSASSGSVYLNGFVIQDLDTNGLNMSGTSALTKLDGGQFESLSTSYSGMSVIQLNNSGTNATSSTNVAFNWEDTVDAVSGSVTAPTPASTAGYYLVSSTGCGSQTIDFTGWTGDFYEEPATFDITTVVNTATCNVNFNGSASAVSLVGFTATAYNGEVDLEWETAFEQDHEGFNVFRSDSEGQDFVQINPSLIRNSLNYVSYKGEYRFVDEDVTNGETYYYYIQDVDLFGNTELHGPRIATPLGTLGAAPITGGGVNDGGSNADDGETPIADPGTISNPSYKDLGDGVQILSQTSSSLRIKIVPPAPVWTASAMGGSFEEVAMSSYSKTLEAGKPELLKRILLIEVHTFATSASLTNQTLNQSTIPTKNVHPAPDWNLNGSNILVPTYTVDNTFYILSQFKPDNFIEVDSSLTTIGGRKFLKITVNPLLYNPVSDDVKKLDDVVLDIGIDGDAWDVAPPNGSVDVAASIVANTLRIDYDKEGVFEITYDEMLDTNVEGPFDGVDPATFRLYQGDTEIPLMVIDADSTFNTGDKLRFYTRFFEPSDDTKNQVTLTTTDINGIANSPKRFLAIDGDPSAQVDTTNTEVLLYAKAEQNNDIILDETIGEGIDHFYWRRIYAPVGGGAMEYLDMPVSMPSMDNASSRNVEVSLTVKGRYVDLSVENEYTHHLGIYVNGSASTVGEVTFKNKDMQTFTWSVPASLFNSGSNTIRARALGTYVSGGQLDHMYVDKVEVSYPAIRESVSNIAYFKNPNLDRNLSVDNFTTANIDVYDVSSPQRVANLSNSVVSTNDGGSTYEVSFFADASNAGYGKRYFVVENTGYLKPTALSLTSGYQETLLNTSHHADLLIVGPKELTDRTDDLVTQREGQGLDVKVVTLDQIYAEFSNGHRSSEAIKEFINFTQSSWTPPYPRYLLFLGDGTYDPKDHFGYVNPTTMTPMPLVEGRFVDFSSDNWFVSSFESYLPNLAVGRIPTHNPVELEDYITKMLDYENGVSIPTDGLMQMSYMAGEELFTGDDFVNRLDELESMSSRFTTDKIDRTALGTNAAMNTAIIDRFNNSTPFMMTYMGHGAFNQWGSLGMFDDSDAAALANSELPIVMGMNCDNTFFYDVDMSWLTLGESLILNKSGGAIAFIGANTQTTPAAQMYLAKQFNRLLIEETNKTYHFVSLGDLLQRSKVALGTDAYSKDIVRSTTLFGDPSMPLPESVFAPAPPVRPSNPSEGAAGGGCTAVASDGRGSNGPAWPEGLLELFMLFALGWGIRRLQKRYLA